MIVDDVFQTQGGLAVSGPLLLAVGHGEMKLEPQQAMDRAKQIAVEKSESWEVKLLKMK